MNIKGGYYLKARVVKNSWIAHASPCTREVWDYLLREACHKDTKYNGYTLKRGQLFRSYYEIREALFWYVGYRKKKYSEDMMKHAMKTLTNALMITCTKTPRGNLIEVLNYGVYQEPKNYEATNNPPTKTPTKTPSIHQSPLAINKNVKELKKKEERSKTVFEKNTSEKKDPDKRDPELVKKLRAQLASKLTMPV